MNISLPTLVKANVCEHYWDQENSLNQGPQFMEVKGPCVRRD